jgi:hypothetical protein
MIPNPEAKKRLSLGWVPSFRANSNLQNEHNGHQKLIFRITTKRDLTLKIKPYHIMWRISIATLLLLVVASSNALRTKNGALSDELTVTSLMKFDEWAESHGKSYDSDHRMQIWLDNDGACVCVCVCKLVRVCGPLLPHDGAAGTRSGIVPDRNSRVSRAGRNFMHHTS